MNEVTFGMLLGNLKLKAGCQGDQLHEEGWSFQFQPMISEKKGGAGEN